MNVCTIFNCLVTLGSYRSLASMQFRQLIIQLCDELKLLNKMEEGVSAPQGLHAYVGTVECVYTYLDEL